MNFTTVNLRRANIKGCAILFKFTNDLRSANSMPAQAFKFVYILNTLQSAFSLLRMNFLIYRIGTIEVRAGGES